MHYWLKSAISFLLIASGAALDSPNEGSQHSLRQSEGNSRGTLPSRFVKRLLGFDEDKLVANVRDGILKSVSSRIRSNGIVMQKSDRVSEKNGRRLSTTDPCTAVTDWPGNVPCGHWITRTRAEVKAELDAILSPLINVPGCLAGSGYDYGSCGVPSNCVCASCLFGFICLARICEDQCYALGLEPDINTLVRYGVEVRKECTSCQEEMTHYSSIDDTGACDPTVYAYDAPVSGLLVLPRDDATGDILGGPIPAAIWSHTSSAATCDIPSAFQVNPLAASVDAFVPYMLGSNGAATIAPDNVGYGRSYDYFKGYILRKQYQTSAFSLWLNAKRIVAQETSCASEVGNQVTISGYSEGGYGAVAIAEALVGAGAEITKLQAGAGPYKVSTALLTTGYNAVASGIFPIRRRHYLPELGQTYSSTYGRVVNYGHEDLLAPSWQVVDYSTGSSTTYTKQNVLDIRTNEDSAGTYVADGVGVLNDITPISASGLTDRTTMDIWNQDFVVLIGDAIASTPSGIVRPCDGSNPVTHGVEKLCDAAVANDLTLYIQSIGGSYPYELCHSPGDEVVDVENVIEGSDPAFVDHYKEVSGDHDGAGLLCIKRFVKFFNTPEYGSAAATRTGDYCPTSSTTSTSTTSTTTTTTTTTTTPTTTSTTSSTSPPQGGSTTTCPLAAVGEPCNKDSDCCSGACSGGKPDTRVCLAASTSTTAATTSAPGGTSPTTACGGNGDPCPNGDGDCCSSNCKSGTCRGNRRHLRLE